MLLNTLQNTGKKSRGRGYNNNKNEAKEEVEVYY